MSFFRRAPRSIRSSKSAGQFGPRSSRLALEQRILFDGAGAVAGADALDGGGDAPEHMPQSQQDQQPDALAGLLGAGLFALTGEAGSDVVIGEAATAEPLTVAEHSELNATGADTVKLDGWKLSGSVQDGETFTVTVTLTEGGGEATTGGFVDGADRVNTLTSNAFGSLADAQNWLNSLQFQTDPGEELGDTARIVTVTANIGGNTFSRVITVTPSNDPTRFDDGTGPEPGQGAALEQDGTLTLTVNEGRQADGSATGPQELRWGVIDPELAVNAQQAKQIVYSLENDSDMPTHGYLTLNGQRLGVGSVFTHQDVLDGKLQYTHTATGADQNEPDRFKLRVNDGATPLDKSYFATIALDIEPINQTPTVGGGGYVYEGQPANAQDTGSVGSLITADTGGDPDDEQGDLRVTLLSLTESGKGGTLFFWGTVYFVDASGNVTATEVWDSATEVTEANITAGFSFAYSQRENLRYAHDGNETARSDQFRVRITDQAGAGAGAASSDAYITLEIRPVDDDPVLGYKDDAGNIQAPVLEAEIPGGGPYSVVLNRDMISAHDVDTDSVSVSFIVKYDPATLNQGEIQIQRGGVWYRLPSGGSFSMQDVTDGNVRYVQTSNGTPEDPTDSFTFQVVDNTNALRWNDDGSTYSRIGGIYDGTALKDHTFTINLANDWVAGGGDGPASGEWNESPVIAESTWGGQKPNGEAFGYLPEEVVVEGIAQGGTLQVWGSNDAAGRPYMSYTVEGLAANQVVYTFMGFSDKGGSSANAGVLQKSTDGGATWVTLNIFDAFTQADLNSGSIRFQHNGGEEFVSTAEFSVSAGLMNSDGTPNVWKPSLTFYATPVNDLPEVAGSESTVIREGTVADPSYAYITTDILNVTDPDDANSKTALTDQNLDTNGQLNGDPNYAVNHDAGHPLMFRITSLPAGGELQYLKAGGDRNNPGDWLTVTAGQKFEAAWLTDDPNTTRLRFVNTGSEVYENTFKVVAIDRWDAESAAAATVTIFVTNVNDAPRIPTPTGSITVPADEPNIIGPDGKPTSGPGADAVNKPVEVYEGGKVSITNDHLQAYDPDNDSVQVQYTLKEVPKYGDLYLNGKKLGVGSSFTQQDIHEGYLVYMHRGGDVNAASSDYDDRFTFALSDGDKETSNEFWIMVKPTNDAPTVEVPSGPIRPSDSGVNVVKNVKVSDPDMPGTETPVTGEKDFIQVTVRLKDANGAIVTNYSGITFGYTDQTPTDPDLDSLWKVSSDGLGKVLQIQGSRAEVNAALAGLTVEFADDRDLKYTLEVIADDRIRDINGNLVDIDSETLGVQPGANGGDKNQPLAQGGDLRDVDNKVYNWAAADTLVTAEVLAKGNIGVKTVEIWSSRTNDAPDLKVPGAATVYEDVRTQIKVDGTLFEVSDAESTAFDTPVVLTISVPNGHGTLHIGETGSVTSRIPSGNGTRAVTIQGNGTGTLVLIGRASDIQALLNETNKAGGLYYLSPKVGNAPGNINHDLNGTGTGNDGDVTVTFKLSDKDTTKVADNADSSMGKDTDENNGNAVIPNEIVNTLALTITAVNDAPTVSAGTGLVTVDTTDPIKVGGIQIGDVDGNDIAGETGDGHYTEDEENGIIQVVVRLQDKDHNALSLAEYGKLGVGFSTTGTSGAVTASGFDGQESALILRGTLAEINAWLAGLQIAFTKAADSNVDQHLFLEVIVDDRIREGDGSLKTDSTDSSGGVANGGTQNQQTNLPEVPLKDIFSVYSIKDGSGTITTEGTKVSAYGVYNVVAATRDLFVSSVNDPAHITGTIADATENDGGTVTLKGLTITDSDALPTDPLTVTVEVPADFKINSVGDGDNKGGTVVISDSVSSSGDKRVVTITGTLEQINSRLNQIVVDLPDASSANGLPAKHWHGSFGVIIVVNDGGNNGLRPGSLTDSVNDPDGDGTPGNNDTTGTFEYADNASDSTDNVLITTRSLTFTVAPTNDAPLVVNPGDPGNPNAPVTLVTSPTEDTEGGTGETVGSLFGNRFSDANDDLSGVTSGTQDAEAEVPDTFWGVAIIGDASVAEQGHWEYSTDGEAWRSVDLSGDKALILGADVKLRFNPSANFHGEPGALTVRLIETNANGTDGTGDTTSTTSEPASGALVASSTIAGGGTSRYSADTLDLKTIVVNVNDRPTGANATLDTIDEDPDEAALTGKTVSDLFGTNYSDITDNQGTGGADIAGGGNAVGDFGGIAIVGNTADSTSQGVWQYQLDGQTGWTTIDANSVSDTQALILPTDAKLRFVPAENYNGTPPALDVRLADTTQSFGSGTNLGLDTDDSKNGTSTWSVKVTLGITVNPVNDAPGFTHAPSNPTVIEDGTTGGATSVPPTSLLSDGAVSDIDLGTTSGLDSNIFGAGTITVSLTAGTFTGSGDVLQIAAGMAGVDAVAGGTGGADLVITLTDTATKDQVAAILAAIKYLNTSDNPTNFGANDTRDYSITLSDGKNAQGGKDAGGTALEKTVTGTITINAVNDPPTATDDANSLEENTASVSGNVKTGTSGTLDTDPDNTNEELKVTAIKGPKDATAEAVSDDTTSATGTRVEGEYGYLIIGSDGSYTYHLDNDNPLVNALADGDTLTETFTYTISDPGSLTDSADLVITIDGRTDGAPGVTPEDMNGPGTGGDATVYESGLRDVPVAGESKTADGTINLIAPDNLVSFTIAGEYVSGDASHTGTEVTLTLAQLKALGAGATVVINTADGQLELTGFTVTSDSGKPDTAGTLSYRYTLAERLDHTGANAASSQDTIALKVTDGKGTQETGNLNVLIIDDAPTARADANSVTEDTVSPITGNVIGGAGSGAAGTDVADTVGADGAKVTGGQKGTLPVGTDHVADGGVNALGSDTTTLAGSYGTLVLREDGSYSYALDNANLAVQGLNAGETLTEVYTYTLTDADGDKSTATLTITINGADDGVTVTVPENHPATPGTGDVTDHVVFERGLTDGSAPNADDLTVVSNFTVKALDGVDGTDAVSIGYTDASGNAQTFMLSKADLEALSPTATQTITTQYGTLVLNGYSEAADGTITVSYTYTLTTAPEVTGADTTDSFTINAKDRDGETDTAKTLNIKIIDDAPTARADTNSVTEDAASPITGNVIGGVGSGAAGTDVADTVGADGAKVTGAQKGTLPVGTDHVLDGGVNAPGLDTTTLAGSYGTLVLREDGSYSYAVDNANLAVQGLKAGETLTEVYTYTLTDADGDKSTTTLTITINGANDGVTVTVPENHPATPGTGDVSDHVVFERGLTDGSAPNPNDLTVVSSFTVKALDGVDGTDAVSIGYTDAAGNVQTFMLSKADLEALSATATQTITTRYGTLVLNGYSKAADGTITVSYTYTLTTAPEVTGADTTDSFTINAKDRDGETDTAKTLNIKIIDDAPTAVADANTIHRGIANPDGYTNEARGNVHANDVIGADGAGAGGPVTGVASHDSANPLVDVSGGVGAAGVTGQYGQLFLQADGTYRYILDASNPQVAALLGHESLTETFAYTITDADGDTSTTTLTITIYGNTPPVAQDDTRVTPEDTPVSGNVITSNTGGDQSDGDPDKDDTLTLTTIKVDADGDGTPETYLVPANPGTPLVVEIIGKGSLTIGSDGSYTFVPVSDWNGQVPDIHYTVHDRADHDDSAVLRITVTPVVDAVPDHTRTESSTPVTIDPLGNDSFKNPDAKITEVTQGGFGTVVITPDGRIIYTPKPGMSGTDTFTYTVTSGGITETTTVTVEVMPENPGAIVPSYPYYQGQWAPDFGVRDPFTNSVVGDPSVFFFGDVFDKLPRMDVPFHPIVYVNREVQLAQQMRERSDLRSGGGNTDYVELALLESRLVSQRIRMAHILYVNDEVSEARKQGWLWAAKVRSAYASTELAGDGRLPTPGLYASGLPSLLAPAQGRDESPAQDEAAAPLSAETPARGATDDLASLMSPDASPSEGIVFANTALQTDVALLNQADSIAAPAFSAQLRGGRAVLPGALWASQSADAQQTQQL